MGVEDREKSWLADDQAFEVGTLLARAWFSTCSLFLAGLYFSSRRTKADYDLLNRLHPVFWVDCERADGRCLDAGWTLSPQRGFSVSLRFCHVTELGSVCVVSPFPGEIRSTTRGRRIFPSRHLQRSLFCLYWESLERRLMKKV
jgi:hypothetical protein